MDEGPADLGCLHRLSSCSKVAPLFAPFLSDRDISAGSWNPQLLKALRNSDVCIAFLTRENLDAEWIHFGAGTIAMRDRQLGLTKLNYNSCRHSDGWPVTLNFADAVGEALINGPAISNAPLAFKHSI